MHALGTPTYTSATNSLLRSFSEPCEKSRDADAAQSDNRESVDTYDGPTSSHADGSDTRRAEGGSDHVSFGDTASAVSGKAYDSAATTSAREASSNTWEQSRAAASRGTSCNLCRPNSPAVAKAAASWKPSRRSRSATYARV